MDNNFLHHIENIIANLGFECVHVGIKNDFGKIRLQILIDTLGGINVDDCELVSKYVNKFLDENQDLPQFNKGRYYLEVSSPGIERPLYKLADYERFSGREARLRLSVPIEGRKTFTGIIISTENEYINLECEDNIYHIDFKNIKAANLVYRFENEKSNKKNNK